MLRGRGNRANMSQFTNQDTRIGQDIPVKFRRGFLRGMATVAGLTAAPGGLSISPATSPAAMQTAGGDRAVRKPNVVLYVADQMRWNFAGSHGLNLTDKTPSLDLYFDILKDNQGMVSGLGHRSLALYRSIDGAHREKVGHPFVSDLLMHWRGRPTGAFRFCKARNPPSTRPAIPSRSWPPSARMSCTVTTCASHSRAMSIGSTGPQRRVK